MIISKCDRCWDGGGAQPLSVSSCVCVFVREKERERERGEKIEREECFCPLLLSATTFWVYEALSPLLFPLSASFFRIIVCVRIAPHPTSSTPTFSPCFLFATPSVLHLLSSFRFRSSCFFSEDLLAPPCWSCYLSLQRSRIDHLWELYMDNEACTGLLPHSVFSNCPISLSPWVRVAYRTIQPSWISIYSWVITHTHTHTHTQHTHTHTHTTHTHTHTHSSYRWKCTHALHTQMYTECFFSKDFFFTLFIRSQTPLMPFSPMFCMLSFRYISNH